MKRLLVLFWFLLVVVGVLVGMSVRAADPPDRLKLTDAEAKEASRLETLYVGYVTETQEAEVRAKVTRDLQQKTLNEFGVFQDKALKARGLDVSRARVNTATGRIDLLEMAPKSPTEPKKENK